MESMVKLNAREVGERICGAICQGLEAAAKIYGEYIDQGGTDSELIVAVPQLPPKFWVNLRAVRDGRLSSKLLAATDGSFRPALALLPVEAQNKACEEGIEVLTAEGQTLKVKLAAMTWDQQAQVFGDGKIRTLAEQRAWMESQKTKQAIRRPKPGNAQFEIDGRKHLLRVMVPCELTRAELLRILAQMEG